MIYKSLCSEYSDGDIKYLSGLCSFVSFSRLKVSSLNEAIGLKSNEVILGLGINSDGIKVFLETKTK